MMKFHSQPVDELLAGPKIHNGTVFGEYKVCRPTYTGGGWARGRPERRGGAAAGRQGHQDGGAGRLEEGPALAP